MKTTVKTEGSVLTIRPTCTCTQELDHGCFLFSHCYTQGIKDLIKKFKIAGVRFDVSNNKMELILEEKQKINNVDLKTVKCIIVGCLEASEGLDLLNPNEYDELCKKILNIDSYNEVN